MGNPFQRQNELNLSPALAGIIPMLSSMFPSSMFSRLTSFLEQMDPEVLETIVSQLSSTKPGRSE